MFLTIGEQLVYVGIKTTVIYGIFYPTARICVLSQAQA